MSQKEKNASAIAIVGMGCRLPRAAGVEDYWELLRRNVDAVGPVPQDRFDADAWHSAEPATPGRLISRHGGFIDDLYTFDADFFGLSPREAELMDPQQRVLLHVVWESLESAGIRPSSLAGGSTGVFVGQATSEYGEVFEQSATADVRAMAGSRLRAVSAGRVSYALDLRGPSLVLDTACSSSLVAVHTARQSLLTGECDLALAAGVNAVLSPVDAIAYSQGGMLSPDGRCKFGDSSADGFVRSEGVGVVVLKRLTDAVADGDRVQGLLLGSAVTNDGRGSGLLLQPAVSGQAEMLRTAWRSAGVAPSQVDYVEAHGTGTTVGDGVELRAMAEALDSSRPQDRPLPVGSVKTNIGHAEAAAGMAGLIKAVLMAQHRFVPASLHLRTPHPLLTEGALPIEIADRNRPLEPVGDRAVLGISSFGLSGTNAHAVVGEYIPPETERGEAENMPVEDQSPSLLVLTARSIAALRRLAARYADFLGLDGAGHKIPLADVCHTAATRRDAHPYRLWAVGSSHEEMAATLRTLAAGTATPDGGIHDAGFGGPRRVAFVFPGQGSQWRGMGRELFASSKSFRSTMTECDDAVRDELGWSVVSLLHDDDTEMSNAVGVVQPMLWAMEVSLAAFWRAAGVEPDVCVGHSMGEVAAACVAGSLSVRDAATVICRRSTLMQQLSGQGAMLSTELSAGDARAIAAEYDDAVCVAAENAPESTVLAGDREAVQDIARRLEERGLFCRLVKVNVASHSPAMEGLRQKLLEGLTDIQPTAAKIDMHSTTRNEPVEGTELTASYWMDNLRQRVRFSESVQALAKREDTVFVEISPHPLLVQAIQDSQDAIGSPQAAVAVSKRQDNEHRSSARAVGQLFALGGTVDWSRWFPRTSRHVSLPLYAWDSEEFRIGPVHAFSPPARYSREVTLRRLGIDLLGSAVTVAGRALVPPVIYFGAVAEAVRDINGAGGVTLEKLNFGHTALSMEDARNATLRITLERKADPRTINFRVEATSATWNEGRPALCVAGEARHGVTVGTESVLTELDTALTRCTEYIPAPEFYRRAESRGYSTAPELRLIEQLWRRDGESVARVRASAALGCSGWESGLLAMIAAWPQASAHDGGTATYLPVAFDSVYLEEAQGEEYWSMASFTQQDTDRAQGRCDVSLTAPDGRLLAAFRGISVRLMQRPISTTIPPSSTPTRPAEIIHQPRTPREAASVRGAVDGFVDLAAQVLGTSVDRVDSRRPLRDLGLDSLMATQLRRRLHTDLGVTVEVSRLLGPESVMQIGEELTPGNTV